MEDLEFTHAMAAPLKTLNLDSIVEELQGVENKNNIEEIEVIFSPLHSDEYIIFENKIVINFFRIKVDLNGLEDEATINGVGLKEYIKEKSIELLQG